MFNTAQYLCVTLQTEDKASSIKFFLLPSTLNLKSPTGSEK